MAGLCEGGNEPPGSLKATSTNISSRVRQRFHKSLEDQIKDKHWKDALNSTLPEWPRREAVATFMTAWLITSTAWVYYPALTACSVDVPTPWTQTTLKLVQLFHLSALWIALSEDRVWTTVSLPFYFREAWKDKMYALYIPGLVSFDGNERKLSPEDDLKLDKRILAVVCNGTKAASTQFNIPIAYACNLGRILKELSLKGKEKGGEEGKGWERKGKRKRKRKEKESRSTGSTSLVECNWGGHDPKKGRHAIEEEEEEEEEEGERKGKGSGMKGKERRKNREGEWKGREGKEKERC
ncbi:hypothetical protein ANN_06964 [Periplaneta americana]|uniref:Uncharacterized protein n=1 Tax=Periplaneta americana TaxID=6978 RepID=A0ABQ8TFV8_PERAM|nr:hypothetical protein ANN_06964 [Periplaneta americana]